MKKLIGMVVGLGLSGVVAASGHLPDLQKDLEDRVNGNYRFECSGYRVDKGNARDWILGKDQLNYIVYAQLSHKTVEFLNGLIGMEGNDSMNGLGLPDVYQP